MTRMQNDRLSSSLKDLLGRFGVEQAGTIDAVMATAREILQQRGHDGEVTGLRHGELHVRAKGAAARMLGWDKDQVLAEIEKRHPGIVVSVIIGRGRA